MPYVPSLIKVKMKFKTSFVGFLDLNLLSSLTVAPTKFLSAAIFIATRGDPFCLREILVVQCVMIE